MYLKEIHSNYERGLSFFSLYKAKRDTLATFTTLKRTPVKIKNIRVMCCCHEYRIQSSLTRDVTDGVAFTTESGNQNFVVFFNESQATVVRDESGDLLAVLDELDTNALANGRVRLLSLNTTR